MKGLSQRIRQFREASVPPGPEDYAFAREILGRDELIALFEAQEPRDVLHGVNTARWLVRYGHNDGELLLAALLHDIGKGPQRTRDRVAWVVAGTLRVAQPIARKDSALEFRRAMARTAEHSAEGARLLREAGAPERVIELTLLHHAPAGPDGMLRLLQAADAAS